MPPGDQDTNRDSDGSTEPTGDAGRSNKDKDDSSGTESSPPIPPKSWLLAVAGAAAAGGLVGGLIGSGGLG